MDSDGESDNSDRVPVPSFQNSFSQAIEAAFMKLDTPVTSDPLSGKGTGVGCSARGCFLLDPGALIAFPLNLRAPVLVLTNIPSGISDGSFLHPRLILEDFVKFCITFFS